jgi:ribose 5-phosphate isomerase B
VIIALDFDGTIVREGVAYADTTTPLRFMPGAREALGDFFGCGPDESVDYPDYAARGARAVVEGVCDRAILICGTGIGMAMAANKVPGVLAANCWDARTARNAREHNHANVLTLGAGHLDLPAAREVLAAFLGTPVGGERHARRVAKILALERERAPRRADTFDPSR